MTASIALEAISRCGDILMQTLAHFSAARTKEHIVMSHFIWTVLSDPSHSILWYNTISSPQMVTSAEAALVELSSEDKSWTCSES